MSKLKQCPFCGGEAILVHNAVRKNVWGRDVRGTVIGCDNCQATMFYQSEKLAIEAWNRRVPVTDEYEVYG